MSLSSCRGKLAAVISLLFIVSAIAGCGPEEVEWSQFDIAEETASPSEMDSLTMAIVVDEDVERDPLLTRSRDLLSLYGLVYESLYTLGDNMTPQSQLAESCEVSVSEAGIPTGTYTIKLRENVVFQDGKALTSGDVAATFSRIKSNPESAYKSAADAIEAFTVIDEKTLLITPTRSGMGFLYSCTFPILPSEYSGNYPVGTGPYAITSVDDGFRMQLSVNSRWWKKAPVIKEITVLSYPSVDGALVAFDQRDISLMASRAASIAHYRGSPGVVGIAYQTREFECLIPNLSSSIIGQKAVREAIMLAVDRRSIVAGVYLNQAVVADVPISTLSSLYEQKAALPQYDINKAKTLLSDSGWGYPDDKGMLYSVPPGLEAPHDIPFDRPPDTPRPTTPPPTPVPASPSVSHYAQGKPLTDRDGNIIYNNDGEPIYAVDPEDDEEEVPLRTEAPPTQTPAPTDTPEPTPYPQERYGLTKLSFELLTNDDQKHPVHHEAAIMIAGQLAQIGMEVKVSAVPFDEFRTRLSAGDFDLALASFYMDQVPDFTPLVGTDGTLNYSGYSNGEMDGYLLEASEAKDEAALEAAMSLVQLRFVKDMPIMPLYFHTGTLITRLELKPGNLWEPDIFRGLLSFGKE